MVAMKRMIGMDPEGQALEYAFKRAYQDCAQRGFSLNLDSILDGVSRDGRRFPNTTMSQVNDWLNDTTIEAREAERRQKHCKRVLARIKREQAIAYRALSVPV